MFTREDREAVAIVRLAHGKVNALDADFCTALTSEITAVAASEATSLVLTGTGSAFSAGVDLFAVLQRGDEYVQRFLPALEALFHGLIDFPKPLVAAINGHALAGGCIIAATCDYRVMAEGTGRIGIPELVVGVPFPAMPFEIMAARLTPPAFRDLVYSGRVVECHEALSLALVDEVVSSDRLRDRAVAHAERLSRIPTTAFALTKRAFVARILDHVQRAAPHQAAVVDAWRSPAVHAAIRGYVNRTLKKPG
jgi:enoyl-CoA hydratase